MRSTLLALALIPAASTQTAQREPAFEVASIKPTGPNPNGSRYNLDLGRMTAENWTLRSYITIAFGLKSYQISGVTGWMDADHYDIVATLEDAGESGLAGDDPRLRQKQLAERFRLALQTLLAERFHLKIHRETKMLPGYALLVAKSGLKLTPIVSKDVPNMHSDGRKLTAERWSMGRMADFLASQLNQPVIDQTHVEGIFNLKLEWSPEDLGGHASSNPSQAPSIFTAIQEQLGLKLEPQKAPVEVVVVDSAERPSEN